MTNLASCIGCGCDDDHACQDGCWWLRVDYDEGKGVCSQCEDHVEAWDRGDHTSHVMPIRIQRKRTKGWKMPANTVIVSRPSLYGNRYIIGGNPVLHIDGELHDVPDAKTAARLYREELEHWIKQKPGMVREMLEPLRGKNLACWCPLDQPCHANTLLEMANK